MNLLYSLPLTVNPVPDDELKEGLTPDMVTPGVAGFLFTLFVAVAIFLLIRDMVKRIRRVRYRSQAMLDEENAAAAEAAETPDAGPSVGPGAEGTAPRTGSRG
ncbi:hypothetical protein BN1051_00766 [Arthrobacter saudimassiliensis]|uniref:Uncharacterized protein n=1 Tax=Arthrobacter saudimassiliensis TaxID=1461584 RepID=A0A078MPV2_9MICC|nr:hypothetical protein BN1051_00766 [Arthrobacter saudimassiliensis]